MHHAYILVGTLDEVRASIPKEDREESPDTRTYSFETLGINEARVLKHAASLRPMVRSSKIFIVAFQSITLEAQNALLKLFEEPDETTRFYLIVSDADMLIPTLRSRLMPLQHTSHGIVHEYEAEVEAFLTQSYAERLATIASRTKEKDKKWTEALMQGLEAWAQKEKQHTILKDILLVRTYSKGHGRSEKMLLEHLALTLP